MSAPTGAPASRGPERELVEAAARHLTAEGFRVRADPDGTDYFDLIARRGAEVGLVEAKVGDARAVLAQALRRRVWGDWVAVVLGSPRSAHRLDERTRSTRSAPVGIWTVEAGQITVVRPASRFPAGASGDPYAALKARLLAILDALDRGDLPAGVRWDGVPRAVRRASGGRGFAEWRLDEIPDG